MMTIRESVTVLCMGLILCVFATLLTMPILERAALLQAVQDFNERQAVQ